MYAWLIKKKNDFRYDLSGVRTSGRPIGSIMSAQPLVWDSQAQVSGESISDVDDQTQPPANVSSTPLSPSLLAGGDNSLDNNSLAPASSLPPQSAGTLDDPVMVDDSGYAVRLMVPAILRFPSLRLPATKMLLNPLRLKGFMLLLWQKPRLLWPELKLIY